MLLTDNVYSKSKSVIFALKVIFSTHIRQFHQQNFDVRVIKLTGTILTQVAAVSSYRLDCNLICRFDVIHISARVEGGTGRKMVWD